MYFFNDNHWSNIIYLSFAFIFFFYIRNKTTKEDLKKILPAAILRYCEDQRLLGDVLLPANNTSSTVKMSLPRQPATATASSQTQQQPLPPSTYIPPTQGVYNHQQPPHPITQTYHPHPMMQNVQHHNLMHHPHHPGGPPTTNAPNPNANPHHLSHPPPPGPPGPPPMLSIPPQNFRQGQLPQNHYQPLQVSQPPPPQPQHIPSADAARREKGW